MRSLVDRRRRLEERVFDSCPPILRRIARIICSAGIISFLVSYSGAAWCWETAHGNPDNSGFADIATAPATQPRTIENIGSFARGAGPVIAPNGTLYIGNEQGKLMSFKADGTPGWSREVGSGESIVASPAIGQDGTIYVVSMKQAEDKRIDSTLHRFNATGGYLGKTVFPDHNGGGGTTASPNFWRFNGIELVIVPALYKREVGGGSDVRLLAFSTSGAVVADQRATSLTPEVTGGSGIDPRQMPVCFVPPIGWIVCWAGGGPDYGGPDTSVPPPPFPGVGIHTNPRGGTPWILLSDHYKDLVGFTFDGATFYEAFRLHDDKRFLRSAPALTADKHTIIGAEDTKRDDYGTQYGTGKGSVLFAAPNPNKVSPITGLGAIYATPTRLPDGRTILIQANGDLAVMNGNQVLGRFPLPDQSIASAAASRTHIFVSTASAFQTFDPASMNEVARIDWGDGGKSPPVIGPGGHVYAIAGNRLFVFPPPITVIGSSNGPVWGGGVLNGGGNNAPPSAPKSQTYTPPTTVNGNRLFACLELDGDDCGQGDHGAIAKAFCAMQGYSQASDIGVDSKKVKAETLDGQYCSKKKCKVFDKIVCEM